MCMIAASARVVHALSEANVDRCVESGGMAEKPMRKVRGSRFDVPGDVAARSQPRATVAATVSVKRRPCIMIRLPSSVWQSLPSPDEPVIGIHDLADEIEAALRQHFRRCVRLG